jgi:hypothetical protein
LDIYSAINIEAKPENIVCRIMPVNHNNLVKWVGIYTKAATQPIANTVIIPGKKEQARLPF